MWSHHEHQNMIWQGQQQPPSGPQQPRVPPPYAHMNYGGQQPLTSTNGVGPHTQQPPLLPDPTWPNQDFMLEQQFSHMSFNQPPPPMFQQPQQGPRPMPSRPGQPNSIPMQRAAINSPGIPSLLDIRVQRPVHMPNGYHRPSMQMPNGQGLGPNPLVTMPNVPMTRTAGPPRNNYPMINTSVPPPRITLLQKPQRATPPSAAMQPQLLTRPQVTSIANPAVQRTNFVQTETETKPYSNGHAQDEPEVESEPEKEPEIKVSKILKRPASTPSMQYTAEAAEEVNIDENLKKREEEYAKVRLRILGSTGQEENNVS